MELVIKTYTKIMSSLAPLQRYFAVFIMIRFVSGKLPDAHNIKVNSMFILCCGGHASIPIFYIPSSGSHLHLINFPSTARFLISKCFANNVHSKSSQS